MLGIERVEELMLPFYFFLLFRFFFFYYSFFLLGYFGVRPGCSVFLFYYLFFYRQSKAIWIKWNYNLKGEKERTRNQESGIGNRESENLRIRKEEIIFASFYCLTLFNLL